MLYPKPKNMYSFNISGSFKKVYVHCVGLLFNFKECALEDVLAHLYLSTGFST